jgi:hypothetical protein
MSHAVMSGICVFLANLLLALCFVARAVWLLHACLGQTTRTPRSTAVSVMASSPESVLLYHPVLSKLLADARPFVFAVAKKGERGR